MSVAVLPFQNLAGDSALAYVGDGLAHEIATSLGRLERLAIKSPSLVRGVLRVHGDDPRRVGRALNVRWVVEGSYQSGPGSLRVTARLVELPEGRQRWSDAWTRETGDLVRIQEDIARSVAQAVAGRLLPRERSRLAAPRSPGYDLALQARFHYDRQTGEGLQRAGALYERALRLDSTYAPAWAGLAQVWTALRGDWVRPLPALHRADSAARRALALDTGSALARVALAEVLAFRDLEFTRADAMLREAAARDPTLVDAPVRRSRVLFLEGRADEGLAEAQRAWEMDSLSFAVARAYGEALYFTRRADELLSLAQRFRGASPLWSAYGEGAAHFLRGDCAVALAAFERAGLALSPYVAVRRGEALRCLGRAAEVRPLFDSLRVAGGDYVPSDALAALHAVLGDTAQALDLLERAFEERAPSILLLSEVPAFDPLRALPRFQALARRARPVGR